MDPTASGRDRSDFRRSLEWVGGWWAVFVLGGAFRFTWSGGGGLQHSLSPIGLLATPFLLVGLRWLVLSSEGDARRRFRRTAWLALWAAGLGHGLGLVGVDDWATLPIAAVGLLSFADAMRAWAAADPMAMVAEIRWRRASRWASLALLAMALTTAAWLARGLFGGRWDTVEVDHPIAVALVIAGVLLELGALLSVAGATHTTLRGLDRPTVAPT